MPNAGASDVDGSDTGMKCGCFMQMTLDTLDALLKCGGQHDNGPIARGIFIHPETDSGPLPEKPAWRKLSGPPQTAPIAARRGRVFGRSNGSMDWIRKNKAKRDESNDLD